MTDSVIYFSKEYNFYGEFFIGDNKKAYSGHLVYTPNKAFYLDLMDNSTKYNIFIRKIRKFESEKYHRTKQITGVVHCVENGCEYEIQLVNSQTSFPFSVFASTRRFFFEGVILIVRGKNNAKLRSVDIQYTGFDKFCCPDIFSESYFDEDNLLNVKLKRNKKIRLNCRYSMKNFDKFFIENKISKYGKMTTDKFENLLDQIKELIAPYENCLIIKGAPTCYSLVLQEKFNSFKHIIEEVYEIKNLFMCLSRYFRTSINFIQLNYREYGKGYMLFWDKIFENENFVCYPHNPFWLNTFDNKKWKVIFDNLFDKYNQLKDFFAIITNNAQGEHITPYSLVHSIDGLKAIKHASKTAYSDAINDFVSNLDKKNQRIIYRFLDNCMDYVKLPSKPSITDHLGYKICELRAYVEHFYDYPNQNVKLETLGELITFFDLIICDYIMKELGITDKYRENYKISLLQLYRIIPYKHQKKK